jgi:hypothetical protein
MVQLLRRRFSPAAGYVLIEQVPPGTGGSGGRYADAVAFGTWRSMNVSRGRVHHPVIGIEVKVSRADWLRELAQPEKSASIKALCDRWYVAVSDERIVRAGELPSGWGMMAVQEVPGIHGATVQVLEDVVPAPPLSPAPMNRPFIAALARRFTSQLSPEGQLQATRDRGVKLIERRVDAITDLLKVQYAPEAREIARRLRDHVDGAHAEALAALHQLRDEVAALPAGGEPE